MDCEGDVLIKNNDALPQKIKKRRLTIKICNKNNIGKTI